LPASPSSSSPTAIRLPPPYLVYPHQTMNYPPQFHQQYVQGNPMGYAQGRPMSPTYSMAYPMFTSGSNPPQYPMSPLFYTPVYPGSPTTSSYHGSPLGPLPLSLSSPSSSTHSAPSSPRPRDKPLVRRSYHPSPPADRSEWVMWVGNVPTDASPDELRSFFTRAPPRSDTGAWDPAQAGVLSIFPISRSNCAFVNYRTPEYLHAAIARFNGVPLRLDGRTPPLVCRVRAKDDDLRAGVGAQRGMGMHRRWVEGKMGGTASSKGQADEQLAVGDNVARRTTSAPPSAYPHRPSILSRPESKSSSSSGASTTSSFLEEYFAERFFILKSLTQEDLDLSVHRGVWATQPHNEGVFDRAFRTSKRVYFIFSVNKSGEFYGYARMSGPLGAVDPRNPVKWARRDSVTAESQPAVEEPPRRPDLDAPVRSSEALLSSEHLVVSSPQPTDDRQLTPSTVQERQDVAQPHAHTAPAMLDAHRVLSAQQLEMKYSLDQPRLSHSPAPSSPAPSPGSGLETDSSASLPERPPLSRIARTISGAGHRVYGTGVCGAEQALAETGIRAQGIDAHATPQERPVSEPAASQPIPAPAPERGTWGQEFPLEWLRTTRLPFERTKNLRNPWNSGREVKISRDGTEVEPEVGKALLAAWDSLGEGA
ncbi:YT521-B-like domain-containing protein, partial [Mycena amicta]